VTSCKVVLSLAVLLLASPLVIAQGTYTQIDYPGGVVTEAFGINSAGDVVGDYSNTDVHGFLLSGGIYSNIDYPGGTSTVLNGVNDNGQMVGISYSPIYVGFLYNQPTQDFTVIDPPKGVYAIPYAINNNAEIGGQAIYAPSNMEAGFALAGSHYAIISPPSLVYARVFGVTGEGMLFGSAYNQNRFTEVYFSYSQGRYSFFSIPPALYLINGVNPQGTTFVGYYEPSSGVTAGFIYNKTLTTLQFPGSSYTVANGINKAGEVVGYFKDANGHLHGFTWTPPADAAKK
jgi:probable HAF family extracellular repeat protein